MSSVRFCFPRRADRAKSPFRLTESATLSKTHVSKCSQRYKGRKFISNGTWDEAYSRRATVQRNTTVVCFAFPDMAKPYVGRRVCITNIKDERQGKYCVRPMAPKSSLTSLRGTTFWLWQKHPHQVLSTISMVLLAVYDAYNSVPRENHTDTLGTRGEGGSRQRRPFYPPKKVRVLRISTSKARSRMGARGLANHVRYTRCCAP